MKIIVTILLILIITFGGLAINQITNNPISLPNKIIDFESCAAAGNPIMESHPRQCRANGKTYVEIIDDTNQITDYFVDQIWKKGVENLGGAIPIEGFDPSLYMGAFPSLIDSDFDGTEAIGGIWKLQEEKLEYIRTDEGIATSADGTLTKNGLAKLLETLTIRLSMPADSEQDIDNILTQIEQQKQIFCTAEQRNTDACITIYQPVCGWSDPDKIKCIRYPCASTFSNSCVACQNQDVLYYTEGECPEG